MIYTHAPNTEGRIGVLVFTLDGTPVTAETYIDVVGAAGVPGANGGFRPSVVAIDATHFAIVAANECDDPSEL